jgi:hypothetical protein
VAGEVARNLIWLLALAEYIAKATVFHVDPLAVIKIWFFDKGRFITQV